MVSYWIGKRSLAVILSMSLIVVLGYGTNYIGGTGPGQSDAAWLVPICIQILPALGLGIGILFMPPSPRWLMTEGREEECLAVISKIRSLPSDHELVQLEYLEVKAQHRFEVETSTARFPQYHAPGLMNQIKLGFHEYLSLLTNRSLFKRVLVAVFIMVFQQCKHLNWTVMVDSKANLLLQGSGVNAILYYAAVSEPLTIRDRLGFSNSFEVHFQGPGPHRKHYIPAR